jgi:hypothetical protein
MKLSVGIEAVCGGLEMIEYEGEASFLSCTGILPIPLKYFW